MERLKKILLWAITSYEEHLESKPTPEDLYERAITQGFGDRPVKARDRGRALVLAARGFLEDTSLENSECFLRVARDVWVYFQARPWLDSNEVQAVEGFADIAKAAAEVAFSHFKNGKDIDEGIKKEWQLYAHENLASA